MNVYKIMSSSLLCLALISFVVLDHVEATKFIGKGALGHKKNVTRPGLKPSDVQKRNATHSFGGNVSANVSQENKITNAHLKLAQQNGAISTQKSNSAKIGAQLGAKAGALGGTKGAKLGAQAGAKAGAEIGKKIGVHAGRKFAKEIVKGAKDAVKGAKDAAKSAKNAFKV